MSITWPDIIIAIIALAGTVFGFRNGFVRELSGIIAIVLALIGAWLYNGSIDPWIQGISHLGPGSAHVIGMFLTAVVVYAIVLTLAAVLDRVARLPVLGTINAIFGAGVGLVKGLILCWVVLYIALFFPLSSDLRSDLHNSPFVGNLTAPNKQIDNFVLGAFPWFAKPFVSPYFRHHHT